MRRVSHISVVFGLLVLMLAGQARAQDREHELFQKLHQRTGEVALGDGVAMLRVGPNFTYLDANDAEIFLTQIWDNQRGSGSRSLGALLPRDVDLLGDASWAVIIDYDEDGYVSDADAKTIDYDKLLSEMQADTAEASKDREKEGGATVALVGWAKQPYYDAATHKLYWAQRLRFGDSDEEVLNYDIRALGRHGTLTLQVVASIGDLPMIEGRLSEILDMVSFNPGQTYAEFDFRTDKTAEYTIAGLIAGGILAKVGFFKALWIGILALKKLIVIGAVALFGGLSAVVKRLLGRNRQPSG